jgi:hypothetical protein
MIPPCWLLGLAAGCVPLLVVLAVRWSWQCYSKRTGAQLQ